MSGSSNSIELLDVSARDGLQNEARPFSTEQKLTLINQVIDAGVRRLEVTSFAHPKHVPQMADAESVIAGLADHPDVTYIGLVMNQRGLDRALNTRIDEIGCITVATDTFAKKNQGQTRKQSVETASRIIKDAIAAGRSANVTIGASFGCPFEGEVAVDTVVDMAIELAEAGPREISLADTIGVGDPWKTHTLFTAIRKALPDMSLRAHLHNTRNSGIANAYAAIQAGVTTLDASVAGIGGCPFAPAATGNIPAEDLLYMLQRQGFASEISLPGLIKTAEWLASTFGRSLPGMLSRAGVFPPLKQAEQTSPCETEMT